MSEINYNSRTWLNPESSHYTGSLVCFDGVVSNMGKPEERYVFLELRDCYGRVRIHVDKNSGDELQQLIDFREKLKLLIDEAVEFKQHLNTKIHLLREEKK